MARYVMLRLTETQAKAAANACDLIADSLCADGEDHRQAGLHERTRDAIDRQLKVKE